MIDPRRRRLTAGLLVAGAFALVLLTACGGNDAPATSSAPAGTSTPTGAAKVTALENLPVARSALETIAPDARLLVASTFEATAPTATPTWYFVFGSPSKGKTYAVIAANGFSMATQEISDSGYAANELSKVPSGDEWKIDSDVAYAAAVKAAKIDWAPHVYTAGVETYRAKSDTSTVEPFTWRVRLFPGASDGTTTTVDVNASTGAASLVQ